MGLFKKKKKAEPAQQPAVPPQGAPAPLFSPPQQPGQFPAAGGMQQAQVKPQPAAAPAPTGFFGSGPQQVPPQPPMQQPAQPAQQPKPAIPSFPKLSPGPKPAPPVQKPAQPTAGQRQADAAAVKAAVQRAVTQPAQPPAQPAQATPLFGAPAAPEVSDFFSELQKPSAGAGAAPAQSPGESSLGLAPLEWGKEEAFPKKLFAPKEPAAPPHSKGRDTMRGDRQLFIAVPHYVSVLDSLKDVRKSVKEFEKNTHSVDSLKKRTLSSCKGWQGHLDDIHKKLAYIDHVLFER